VGNYFCHLVYIEDKAMNKKNYRITNTEKSSFIFFLTSFILIVSLTAEDVNENLKKASQLILDGEKIFKTKKDANKSYEKFQEAVKLAPEDGKVLSDAGWWIYNPLGKPKEALPILQSAVKATNVQPLALSSIIDVYTMLGDFESAFEACEKAIEFWEGEIKKFPNDNREYRENELVEVFGKKANVLISQAKFDSALELTEEVFAKFPTTKNQTLIYAKCEVLHIRAGYKLEKNNFNDSEELIKQCVSLYKRNPNLSNKENSKYKDLQLALSLLSKRKAMGKISPATTQKILSFIVEGIDIDQEIKGKRVKANDKMKEDMIYRLKAGQFWYKLYLEVMTNGQLSLEFKNVEAGTAKKLLVVPLKEPDYILEIDPDSITPSISSVLSEHQNYDHFLFYWNGKTSGLNLGTGVAYQYSPLTLAGFSFGQPRGYSIMATNPEMYGLFDGLLHHEYGHLLEALSQISFVHCTDLTVKDKVKPVYSTWNKSCDTIYDWFLNTALKGKYSDMNWQKRYPANVSK
jgi:tetratricopeptide (TPR) repeat protein